MKKRKNVKFNDFWEPNSWKWNAAVKTAEDDWWVSYLASTPTRDALVKMITEFPKTIYKPVFIRKRTKPAQTKKRSLK